MILAIVFGSMWLFPIVTDGTKSVLMHAGGIHATRDSREFLSVISFAIWVLIAFAWRRSARVGAIVEGSIVLAVVAWSLAFDRTVLTAWWSYAGILFLACFGLWFLVLVLGLVMGFLSRRVNPS